MSDNLRELLKELKEANDELAEANSAVGAIVDKIEQYLFISKLEEGLINSIKEKVPVAEDIGLHISRNGLTVSYFIYSMLDIHQNPRFTIFFPWDDKIFS